MQEDAGLTFLTSAPAMALAKSLATELSCGCHIDDVTAKGLFYVCFHQLAIFLQKKKIRNNKIGEGRKQVQLIKGFVSQMPSKKIHNTGKIKLCQQYKN